MDMKLQKKHESDMTAKEKRELEREKLASMHGLEKVEYILTYYKFHILGLVALVLAVIGIVHWADSLKNEDYLYVAVVDAPTDAEDFIKDFRTAIKDEEERHIYTLDTSIFYTRNQDGEKEMDYTTKMQLTTLVGAGSIEVMICPKETYDIYSGENQEEGQEVLYPVSQLMGEDFVTEHKDICKEDAILVTDNEVLEKYGLSSGEPAYLMVFQYAKHPEIAKEFIDFVIK